MDHATRLKRLHFRAHHRGTREADLMIGGFFDTHHTKWNEAELVWFEHLIEQQDVDIMAWACRAQPVPPEWDGPMMLALQRVEYVNIQR